MAEIHGGQIAARQLRQAGIDTVYGVVAGPMIEVRGHSSTSTANTRRSRSAQAMRRAQPGVASGASEAPPSIGAIAPAKGLAFGVSRGCGRTQPDVCGARLTSSHVTRRESSAARRTSEPSGGVCP